MSGSPKNYINVLDKYLYLKIRIFDIHTSVYKFESYFAAEPQQFVTWVQKFITLDSNDKLQLSWLPEGQTYEFIISIFFK